MDQRDKELQLLRHARDRHGIVTRSDEHDVAAVRGQFANDGGLHRRAPSGKPADPSMCRTGPRAGFSSWGPSRSFGPTGPAAQRSARLAVEAPERPEGAARVPVTPVRW